MFLGGGLCQGKQLFLNGQIRAGRDSELRGRLTISLVDNLVISTSIDRDQIWTYITELPPNQMIEYGEVLPLSGQEKEWFATLPIALQEKLMNLGK